MLTILCLYKFGLVLSAPPSAGLAFYPMFSPSGHSVLSAASLPSIAVQDDPSNGINHQTLGRGDLPIFNPVHVQNEIRNVAAKYSKAPNYLQQQNINSPLNFTQIATEFEGHDATLQVAGSTFVMGLQTYGDDLSYYGPVALGTTPQSLLFDIDTGSADLWVPSGCNTCNPNKAQFYSGASSTYQETEDSFSLAYGTGNVEGKVALETVTIGPLSVEEQYFGSVSKESDDFTNVPFDGVIGMAFSSVSATRKPTFMERLIQGDQLNAPVFGVHLTRHKTRNSEVCFGCYDTSKFIDTVSWHPVTSRSYWNVALTNIRVNGVNTAPREITAAIDTGTSFIYFPQDLADATYRQIPGSKPAPQYAAGIYTYPCVIHPVVSLYFGVDAYQIDERDFNLGKTSSTGDECVGGILAMGSDFPSNLAIIGAEFLKSWYSIYDYDHGTRVGFAKSINQR